MKQTIYLTINQHHMVLLYTKILSNTYPKGKFSCSFAKAISVCDHDNNNFMLLIEKPENYFLVCFFIVMPCFELRKHSFLGKHKQVGLFLGIVEIQ
jgi:hypothetical protein